VEAKVHPGDAPAKHKGIEEILRENDRKRGRGDPRQDAYEREFQGRFLYSEHVAATLVHSLWALRDKAIGEPVRLPIAAKSSESPVFIECEGIVRLTLLCHIRADQTGVAHCSAIDIGMSRNGSRMVRCSYEPIRAGSGGRAGKLGVIEKHFAIDLEKFRTAIQSLAKQL
jgi:hypothetical protein